MKKECYENFANAIIVQAVKDYARAIRAIAKNKNSIDAKKTEKEVLSFLHSEWFAMLTDINPDILINKIHKEVFDNDNKTILKSSKVS